LVREKVSRVLLMLADEQKEMGRMEEGNIAVAVGMKDVRREGEVFLHNQPPQLDCMAYDVIKLLPPDCNG
jgi:translation elongation factor EF-G